MHFSDLAAAGGGIQELWHEIGDEPDLVSVTEAMSRPGHQQDGDMRQGAVIADAGQTAHAGFFDRDT
jgi:hypothetical protein